MKRINFIYLLVLALLGNIGLVGCSSSSKRIPDFTGIYKGVTEVPYYNLIYGSKVYLRPSTLKDPYKVNMEVVLFRDGSLEQTTFLSENIAIDGKNTSDDYFTFKGKQAEVNLGEFGMADVTFTGVVEGKSLTITYDLTMSHKPGPVPASFVGGKLNRKENDKAQVVKVTIDSPLVYDIVINESTKNITVKVDKDISEATLKQLEVGIQVSEGATYTQSYKYLDPRTPMKITVLSEDRSTTETYTVLLEYIHKPS